MPIIYARLWIVSGLFFTIISGCGYWTMPDERVDVLERETTALSNALIQYKLENGEFPPCMAKNDPDRIEKLKRHLKKVFPRHTYKGGLPTHLNLENLDPTEAVVFFLGGVPSSDEPRRNLGFSTNPTDPLASLGTSESTFRAGYYEFFEKARLTDRDQDGFWEYSPRTIKAPFVYFDANSYDFGFLNFGQDFGDAAAYYNTANDWQSPEGFQLISSGRDNSFGKAKIRVIKTGKGLNQQDEDNYTSFGRITDLRK
jgi:hypothetical protein